MFTVFSVVPAHIPQIHLPYKTYINRCVAVALQGILRTLTQRGTFALPLLHFDRPKGVSSIQRVSSTSCTSLSCNMDIIALQVESDGWLSNSRTVHDENFNNEEVGFQYSRAACEKVAKDVKEAKAPGKEKGKNIDKSKAGHHDGTGYVSLPSIITRHVRSMCCLC